MFVNVLVADFQLATQKKQNEKDRRFSTASKKFSKKLSVTSPLVKTHCVHIVDKETDSAALLLLVFPVEGDFLQGAR